MTTPLESAKARLEKRQTELAHAAKKSLGQNFLISDHVISKIIQEAKKTNETSVIEIGPGLGALTDELIKNHMNYTAMEMDRGLSAYWQQQGLSVIEGDALEINWENLSARLLVSNLPYQISSTLVIERSLNPFHIRTMILMFQKEVAQRIRAQCKTPEYGMLSVIAQEFWTIETVCDAGPKDFSPPPKIASRVLKFTLKESPIQNRTEYLKFIKMCFQQRRRILKSNLDSRYHENYFNWLSQNNFSDKLRAEELSPDQLKHLYLSLTNSLASNAPSDLPSDTKVNK